jgi:hypothetical protein
VRKATYSDGLSTVGLSQPVERPVSSAGPPPGLHSTSRSRATFPPRLLSRALGTDLAGPETWAGGSCSPVAAMSRSRRCSERDTEAEADLNLNMHLHCTSRSRSREDVRMMRGRRRICSDLIFWTASGLQISQMLAAVPMLWRRPR